MQDENRNQQQPFRKDGYPYSPEAYDDEIDLLELWHVIWQGKWIIVGVTATFAVTAVIVSLLLPNIYRSEVLLAPANASEQGVLASMGGQLGGLASLAGIDIGAGVTDKATLALEVLKSRAFVSNFIRRYELEVPLIAAKGWDREAGEWIIDQEIYNSAEKKWVRKVDPPKKPEPSNLEIHKVFTKEVLTVNEDKNTGLIRVGIELMSPIAAQKWLDIVVKNLNDYVRKEDVEDAEKSIQYLQKQLGKTSVAEMQNIFYQLIEQQTKKIMLAEVRNEYVFKVVDPPVVPEEKTAPNRVVICVFSALTGGFFAVFLLLANWSIGKRIRLR